jgi:hypothetical protein
LNGCWTPLSKSISLAYGDKILLEDLGSKLYNFLQIKKYLYLKKMEALY